MGNRYLYIVARTQPRLYEELTGRFADDPKVTVILDRRHDEQRSEPPSLEAERLRQQRDRRRNEDVQEWLRTQSYAVVTIST